MNISTKVSFLMSKVDRTIVPENLLEGADEALQILSSSIPPQSFYLSPNYAKLCKVIIVGAPKKLVLAKDSRAWLSTVSYSPGLVDVNSSVEVVTLVSKDVCETFVLIISELLRLLKTVSGNTQHLLRKLVLEMSNGTVGLKDKTKGDIKEDTLSLFEEVYTEVNWRSSYQALVHKIVS